MEKKRYLKWYNKVGYGSGDLAGNVVYAFLSSFVMLYSLLQIILHMHHWLHFVQKTAENV